MTTTRLSLCNIIVAAATVLLHASCQRTVDFDGKLPSPSIVINSFVAAGDTIAARISRSWNLAEDGSNTALNDAAVMLYVNDELRPPMQHVVAPNPYPNYRSATVAREGDRVRITVNRAGCREATAGTVIPGKATILSVNILREGSPNSPDLRCLIRFKDLEAGRKNCYRLVVDRIIRIQQTPDREETFIYGVNFDYDRDAALKAVFDNLSVGDLTGSERRNDYRIFDDDIFDGREYTLNISFNPNSYIPNFPGGNVPTRTDDEYVFKLVTLSEEAFKYLKSRTLYAYSGSDPFSEPVSVHTNVDGGLGILGGFNADTVIAVPPDR